MQIQHFQTEKDFINESINLIENICSKKGEVYIALSGGKTPESIYKALSQNKKINFGKIKFYQVDERYVPPHHPNSNQKMINQSLIHPLKKNLHAFNTKLSINKALQEYEKILSKKFDLVILGIGQDGHVASLFPHHKALKDHRLVTKTQTENFAVKDRLTLNFPLILGSENILILLKGKQEVLEELENGKKSVTQFPAKKLVKHKSLTIFHLNI